MEESKISYILSYQFIGRCIEHTTTPARSYKLVTRSSLNLPVKRTYSTETESVYLYTTSPVIRNKYSIRTRRSVGGTSSGRMRCDPIRAYDTYSTAYDISMHAREGPAGTHMQDPCMYIRTHTVICTTSDTALCDILLRTRLRTTPSLL